MKKYLYMLAFVLKAVKEQPCSGFFSQKVQYIRFQFLLVPALKQAKIHSFSKVQTGTGSTVIESKEFI